MAMSDSNLVNQGLIITSEGPQNAWNAALGCSVEMKALFLQILCNVKLAATGLIHLKSIALSVPKAPIVACKEPPPNQSALLA